MSTSPSRSLSFRPYLLALGLCWVLPALAVAVAYAVQPKDPPNGQCEGIGFGCTLSPADAAVFLGLIAAPFLLVAGLMACVLIAAVQHRRVRRAAR